MRINILQHTPNESAGSILTWAEEHRYDTYVYHPYYFRDILPSENETDLLVILGGPMSPCDDMNWIQAEQELIQKLLDKRKPILGICFGAQQIAKTLGYGVRSAPNKEVGWSKVYSRSDAIPNIPNTMTVLHWHEDIFDILSEAQILFSSKLVENQGFLLGDNVIGLQFHLEPKAKDVREIVINNGEYALDRNSLHQSPNTILNMEDVDFELNERVLYGLLDYITNV